MTALNRPTCEAIAKHFRAIGAAAHQEGHQGRNRSADWAGNEVLDMMLQRPPEPPAPPFAGALRAARAYASEVDIYAPVAALATVIDEQTGLPNLVAACRNARSIVKTAVAAHTGKDVKTYLSSWAVCEELQTIDAALAKHDGVPESASQENKHDG